VLAHQFRTGFRPRSAADEERRPGMRHPERHRRKRTLRLVAGAFVGADPVAALVLAFHVAAAWRDRVALDRLASEGGTLGGPVLKGAGFKIEVERPTISPNRQHAF